MKIEPVQNFFEDLVMNRLLTHVAPDDPDPDYLADVACVALNRLPHRYVRHIVDLVFFMPQTERAEIDRKVAEAVTYAVNYIAERTRAA